MKKCYFLFAAFLIFQFQIKAQVTVNVTVDVTKPGYKVTEDFVGLSMEQKTLTTGLGCCGVTGLPLSFFEGKPGIGNGRLINLFHNISSNSILRMGGGTVDKMRWVDANRTASDDSLNLIYRTDVAKLFTFLRQAGWKAIYSLDFGSSDTDGIGHPANAVSEAKYVFNNYSDVLNSISIGNEPEGFANQGFRPTGYNAVAYMPEYLSYYDAIKAANPAIPISGGDLTQEPAGQDWENQYLASINNKPGNTRPLTALNVHGYALSNNMNTIRDTNWLVDRLMNYTMPGFNSSPLVVNLGFLTQSATNANVPLRYSETGSSASDTAKVSNKFITAIWVLDYCYALATAKISGTNFHGGGGSPYSVMFWGGGNNDPAKNALAATYPVGPIYYGLLAFVDGAKNMRLLPVTPASPQTYRVSPRASYYATISDDGKTAKVTIINKDTLKSINAVVSLPNQSIGSASYRTLSFTNSLLDLAANTKYAGAQVASDGTFTPAINNTLAINGGNSFTVPVAPITAAVVIVNLQSTVLPITFLSFTGQSLPAYNLLSWATSTETNNQGFEVQKSLDGNIFEKVGFVNGRNTGFTTANYLFADSAIHQNQTFFYRLKQVDVDGKSSFSSIVQIKTNDKNGDLYSITPNPNNGNFTFSSTNTAVKTIKLYNALGAEILIKTAVNQPNRISITASHLAAGIYYLHAFTNSGELVRTMKVVVNKKI